MVMVADATADVNKAVKIGCRVCFGVLWVGRFPNGKHFCQKCKVFTAAV